MKPALVPFPPKRATKSVASAISTAFADFEKTIGGRPALIAALSLAPLTPDIEDVLSAIGDPILDTTPLAEICAAHGLQPGHVIMAYHKAQMSLVQVLAMQAVAGKVTEIAAEIVRCALPHRDDCSACGGSGKIAKAKKPGRGRPPKPLPCVRCKGVGTVTVPGLESQQDRVFDLAHLVQKGGGINIGIANQNNPPAPTRGSTESPLGQLQQAISAVLSGKVAPSALPDASVVDATVLPAPAHVTLPVDVF